ncbi:hypothetical protein OCH239_01590 [Roseivivax halodurans JCM 10272]|uniref:AsmA-like C-terminal domain-containing protein n=1 Tax=Roseivivax halodurans JCM 10272 TaxID=1449350 RepID=X7EKY6_9RHOB|nr:AsmA-like C-terminal region-containing protein [Roseivivax halodurans]ETX16545.1 hypothetical protein OCH239_01590 [Roseivivax halodurans JCM 10272]
MTTAKGQRRRRWPIWLAGSLVLVAMLVAVGIGAIVGRPLVAPDWLSDRIETRIADLVPGARIGFGDLNLRIGHDGLVHVGLDDASLVAVDGTEIAALAEIEIAAALAPLFEGRVALREARASGGFLSIRRGADGRIGIGLGVSGGTPPSVPDAVAAVDAALEDPRLAGLDEVTLDNLNVRYADARANRTWRADGGRIVVRREEGTLRLSGSAALLGAGDRAATLEVSAESAIGETDLSFGMSLGDLSARDIATQSPALAWLDVLRAPISGSFRGWLDDGGGLGGLDATLRIGPGVLQPTDAAEPIRFTRAQTYFSYLPETGVIDFSDISVESEAGRGSASGRAQVLGGDRAEIVGQFIAGDIDTNPAGAFVAPLQIARAEMDLRLKLDPFRLDIGRLRIADPDKTLRASGHIDAGPEGWSFAVDASAEEVAPETVERHWPPAIAPGTRDWVVSRVIEGRARDVVFSLRRAPGAGPELFLDLGFDGAKVRFSDDLPPAEGGAGRLVIANDRIAVSLAEGYLTAPEGGEIDLAGSEFVIPDTRQQPATGDLRLAASGPVTAALSVLNLPPLSILDKAGQPVDLAAGTVEVTGSLVRPLEEGIDYADLDFRFEGIARDVESKVVVPGRRLAAEALDLSVTPEQVRLSGAATLSGVPFDGSWTQPIGPGSGDGRVSGTARLSPEAADAFGVGLPSGLLSGGGPAQVTVDLPSGAPPRFRLTSSLGGIGLAVPQIGWQLPRAGQGELEIAGVLSDPARIDTLRVDAGGLSASGRVALRGDGGLEAVTFDRVRIGDWLDAPVTLVGRGGAAPAVQVGGGSLDLRGADFGGGGSGSGGGADVPLDVSLDRLTISEGIQLLDLNGNFSARNGGLAGNFAARMQGTSAEVQGQLLPQGGGTALRLSSEDAGNVLESTGILKTVAGGRMVLNLNPTGTPGTYDGAVTVTDARLRDAPAIGALLDAISVVGIIDQLEGPGIYFQDVQAQFRLEPSRVVLTRSSAVGPSMGVSLDGYVDLASGVLDLQGVLSPVYVLNSIGAIFTRRGEGLLGFNFNIEGTADAPRVAVNPLSVFTPGMFREIFRRPPPTTR